MWTRGQTDFGRELTTSTPVTTVPTDDLLRPPGPGYRYIDIREPKGASLRRAGE